MTRVHRTTTNSVAIAIGTQHLDAELAAPTGGNGIVVFAHGSGSGRQSPRNRFVAEELGRAGIGTLLLDLLTSEEAREDERTLAFRFDIPRLGDRLVRTIDWLAGRPDVGNLPVGLYGASTGGAAALIAAARKPDRVRALVLRGARSDLADAEAARVAAPTLFVVGGRDSEILRMNRATALLLSGSSEITIVPDATHLFEEPGALETVAKITVEWFRKHLGAEAQVGA